jgi:ABC-type phosphate transport system substrate-binding protein
MLRVFTILLVGVLLWQQNALAADSKVIAIVVANEQAGKSISMPELKLIYWRKKDYWANGRHIHPVNLPADNPLRMRFSNKVLGSLPSTQTDYWNEVYFHGVSPPYVVNSEEAVLRYVAETAGAIGYINVCNVDNRVKAIAWLNENGDLVSKSPEYRCGP